MKTFSACALLSLAAAQPGTGNPFDSADHGRTAGSYNGLKTDGLDNDALDPMVKTGFVGRSNEGTDHTGDLEPTHTNLITSAGGNSGFNTAQAETPNDCVYTESGWSACSISCQLYPDHPTAGSNPHPGAGVETLTRTITQPGRHGGKPCPPQTETRPCTPLICPIDCVTEPWNVWSVCSVTCGTGTGFQRRERDITTEAMHGGVQCGTTVQTRECTPTQVACDVHCETSAWGYGGTAGAWSTCSATCGGGTRTQTRTVITAAAGNGLACGRTKQTQVCGTTPCEVDCVPADDWGAWTSCTAECGGGTQEKRRRQKVRDTVTDLAAGDTCDDLVETRECNDQTCPVDCEVSNWSAWGACTQTCGKDGTRTRTRTEVRAAAHNGLQCPHLSEVSECESPACPVDCQTETAWNAWSTCTVTCGPGGVRNRHKKILVEASNGGTPCVPSDYRQDNQACVVGEDGYAAANCPVDCVPNPWGAWSECDRACCNTHSGEAANCGSQTRTATRNIDMAYGGTDCTADQLSETQSCTPGPCAVDCDVTTWTDADWTDCKKDGSTNFCGVGTQYRERTVSQIKVWTGHVCPELKQERECVREECPSDCEYTAWSPVAWSMAPCSVTCGAGGTKQRHRSITKNPVNGGAGCGATVETQECTMDACPIPCTVSAWGYGATPETWTAGAWSACSVSCGKGLRTQTRTITNAGTKTEDCPSLSVSQYCNEGSCSDDCTYTDWENTGMCDKSCGAGAQRTQTRRIVKINKHGGSCGDLTRQVNCADVHVANPVPGYTEGSVVSDPYTTDYTPSCPTDCEVDNSQSWGWGGVAGACSEACGENGIQEKLRPALNGWTPENSNGGVDCPATRLTRACNRAPCPVDCTVTTWTDADWGPCSVTCGGGVRVRSRDIVTISQWGGHVCPELQEEESCNTKECEIDCKYYDLGVWGPCSVSCGTGVQHRSRSIYQHEQFGGDACPSLTDSRECDAGNCPIHCEVSDWGNWGDCSVTCGLGNQVHTRTVNIASQHGGNVCPILSETRQCLEDPCPVDCVLSEWENVGTCSQECSSAMGSVGYQLQVKRILRQPTAPNTCGDRERRVECNSEACPVDCRLSQWTLWEGCDKTCGVGQKHRTRSVAQAAVSGHRNGVAAVGAACATETTQYTSCNAGPCPVDCDYTTSEWGVCSHTCPDGAASPMGTQTRTRTITNDPNHQVSTVCPATSETRPCKTDQAGATAVPVCNIDCEMDDYSGWMGQTATCGKGTEYKTRQVKTFPSGTGQPCPTTENTVFRDLTGLPACPVDCVFLNKGYGQCSKACGTGSKTETIHILTQAVGTGTACPTPQTIACNQHACTSDTLEDRREFVKTNGSPSTYDVTYTTGADGSNTAVEIQFHGTDGSSPFMTLGSSFIAGQSDTKSLTVDYKIGLLHSISIKGGSDAWDSKNFINVVHNGNTIQFATDYTFENNQRELKAVNPEEGTPASSESYVVTVRTSSSAGSGSADPMYIQLTGTTGSSNYYRVGSGAIADGANTVFTITTNNHIGPLHEITLQAGAGTDSWHPLGYITVVHNSQDIKFWTDIVLDASPESGNLPHHYFRKTMQAVDAETAYDATQTVVATKTSVAEHGEEYVDNSESYNVDRKTAIQAATTAAPAFDKSAVNYDQNTAGTIAGDGSATTQTEMIAAADASGQNTDHTGATNAPTDAPTAKASCANGAATVVSGWVGECAGDDYCNKCSCDNGVMTKTTRVCDNDTSRHGIAVGPGASKCVHTQCEYSQFKHPLDFNMDSYPKSDGYQRKIMEAHNNMMIVTNHSSAEQSANHRCAFNRYTDECECFCWGAREDYATTLSDMAEVASASYTGGCSRVDFKHPFSALKGTVKVIATGVGSLVDAKNADTTGFTACGAEGTSFHFYAYQGENHGKFGMSPFGGAESGVETVAQNGCKTVQFARPSAFGKTPMMVGSSTNGNAWVENINKDQFKVCSDANADFTWVAVEHKNPQLWISNQLPYINAGTVAHTAKCTPVTFTTSQANAFVQLLPNHRNPAASFSATSGAVSVYVQDVTSTGFKACVTDDSDTTGLQFDYITFTEGATVKDGPQ